MASTIQAEQSPKKKKIFCELIYEEMDGQPIYYAGYQDVINNNKTLDDIMGSSHLQSVIIKRLFRYLLIYAEGVGFEVLSSGLGLHISKRNNLAADIATYRSDRIEAIAPADQYLSVSSL